MFFDGNQNAFVSANNHYNRNTTSKFPGCELSNMFDFPESICLIFSESQNYSHNLVHYSM